MHFVAICKDKPDPGLRLAARADHLEFVETRQDRIVYGGPLIDQGQMIGSIFIFDVPDREALDEYMGTDPYFVRGIFETVEIYQSRWMVPERSPGVLAAEIVKARSA